MARLYFHRYGAHERRAISAVAGGGDGDAAAGSQSLDAPEPPLLAFLEGS
jgi:hypothetical protein